MKAAERLARQFGVSVRTIYRDAAFARMVDADPELLKKIMNREPIRRVPKCHLPTLTTAGAECGKVEGQSEGLNDGTAN